ncbi:MAG TPA: hypothetical protein VIV60_11430 [Polyangiaceae bacterium]
MVHLHQFRSWVVLAMAIGYVSITSTASALVNAGVEAGLVKRTAPAPDNMNVGFGYGAHAELTFESTFAIGAYYLHSTHAGAGSPSEVDSHSMFDTLGARGRLILPMPGRTQPYVLVGIGHNWVTYGSRIAPDVKGSSWEVPIGLGFAHRILGIFQLSLEGAYRPSFSFSGHAYNDTAIREPTGGWSLTAGISLDL